jgi:DNA modification methylase
MADRYEIHPYCELIPEMTSSEYVEFREDIRAHGLNKPIIVWQQHWIIDGRHRDRACEETKTGKRYIAFTGQSEREVLDFIISENIRRRHLSESQRAMIAVEIENFKHGGNRKVQAANLQLERADTAAMLNVSPRSVASAAKVKAHGEPELVDAVKQGKIAVSTAATLADAPRGEQKHLVELTPKEIHAKSKELKAESKAAKKQQRRNELAVQAESFHLEPVFTAGDIRIIHADGRTLLEYVEPGTADLVVSSPPYNVGMKYDSYGDNLPEAEYRNLLASLYARCYVALKEGGRIAIVVPLGVGRNPYKPFAPFVQDILDECGFNSRGWIVWDKNNVQNSTAWGSHRMFTNPALRDRAEVILVADKGDGTLEAPEGTLGKDEHGTFSEFLRDPNYFAELTQNYWRVQPETRFSNDHPAPFPELIAQRLVHLYAFPGALIVDPCMGTGTVAVVAKRNRCRAVCLDIDDGYCAFAKARVEKEA